MDNINQDCKHVYAFQDINRENKNYSVFASSKRLTQKKLLNTQWTKKFT